jgi:NADPH2:quinone reductase
MRAVLCKTLGPAEGLVIEEIASPVAGPGEAVVAVEAAGLNFFDTLVIEGRYQEKPALPFSPSAEFAGRVKSIGSGVSGFEPGDRVMGYAMGAAREEIAVAAERLIPVPAGVTSEVAASLMVTYGTTLHALRDRARLQPGETLAVLGASGGVGVAAVDLGKALGARVIACASSDDKLELCRRLGADATVNYSNEDLKDALKRLTDGRGADVVYDPVGGDLAEAALRATAWRGRFLVIGFASGTIPRMPLNLALLKGCDIVGVFWGEHTRREPDRHRASIAELLRLAAEGKIHPHIDEVLPLERTAEALGRLARREVKGKLVLRP